MDRFKSYSSVSVLGVITPPPAVAGLRRPNSVAGQRVKACQ